MIRKDAIELCVNEIKNQPIISANGFISRDLFNVKDKNTNFYMIGSMGLSSSIALGISLNYTKKKIYVFDGDGNILMNLGSLVTIGAVKPKNFVHVVFDNSIHESTGGQPTNSTKISFDKIAMAANFTVIRISNKRKLITTMKKINKMKGPIMLIIKVQKSNNVSIRVQIKPKLIFNRLSNFLQAN